MCLAEIVKCKIGNYINGSITVEPVQPVEPWTSGYTGSSTGPVLKTLVYSVKFIFSPIIFKYICEIFLLIELSMKI
jgi:hypothetical protein